MLKNKETLSKVGAEELIANLKWRKLREAIMAWAQEDAGADALAEALPEVFDHNGDEETMLSQERKEDAFWKTFEAKLTAVFS